MRTFLAVPVPTATANALFQERLPLRKAWDGVRWVIPENYHITLAFLGERSPEAVGAICRAINEVWSGTWPGAEELTGFRDFWIEPCGVGYFGRSQSPRVIFEQLEAGGNDLIKLRVAIRPALEALIRWEETKFRPHVTLGRARRSGAVKSAIAVQGAVELPIEERRAQAAKMIKPFRAQEVILYKSEQKSGGAIYSPIESWPLE